MENKYQEEGGEERNRPDLVVLEQELAREHYKARYVSVMQSTIFTLITVAAVAVLIATLWMPVLQIYGNSMSPNLESGNIVVCFKSDTLNRGDIIAFYFNNKILVKRVIGTPGDVIEIDEEGNFTVNGTQLREEYVQKKALGECNITMPYTVPQGRVFVVGDNRVDSVDSRNNTIGSIEKEQIIGKLLVRVWPFAEFGLVK